MDIVVAIRPVPEVETRLRARADGTRWDDDGVKFVLAGYDESAVEQALLLKEAGVATAVHVVSAGPAPRTEEVLRAALALGADSATWVEVPAGTYLDSLGTARAVATALAKIPHDLVLVGKQAGDDEAGLVGPALAEFLGLPSAPAATDVRWDAGARAFTFRIAVEGGSVRARATAPLLLALQQAWNDPRTARLPNILKSRRATIARVAWSDLEGSLGDRPHRLARPVSFRLPPPRSGAKILEYSTPEDAAQKLLKVLKEEAKVFP